MKHYNDGLKGKIFNYVQQRLSVKPSTNGWHRGDCPYCLGNNTFGIHFQEHRAHCFKCQEAVSPIKLILDLEHFERFSQVYELLKVQEEFQQYTDTARRAPRERIEVILPEGFHSIGNGNKVGEIARNYLIKKRGFKLDDLILRGIGYYTDGPYAGYIIFPFYQNGRLVYFQTRQFIPIGPKMKNPSEEEFGIGKGELFYNEDALFVYNQVRLVESVTNSITLGDKSIASLGKKLSSVQIYKILKSPCTKLTILLDPDAYLDAINLGMNLVHYKKLKVVKLPEGKDVNDLGKKETILYEERTPYQSYQDLHRIRTQIMGNAKERAKYTYH